MDHDKLINFVTQCTYSTCIGGAIASIMGWIGANGQIILVFIALFSAKTQYTLGVKRDKREQQKLTMEKIEFERRLTPRFNVKNQTGETNV